MGRTRTGVEVRRPWMDEWEPHDVAGDPPATEAVQDGDDAARAAPAESESSEWECNICFEALKIEESCLTSCGHLYCWPCLHKWIDTFRQKTSPPVCPGACFCPFCSLFAVSAAHCRPSQ